MLNRLLFANFWTLKLSRTMTYLQMKWEMDGASHPPFFFVFILMLNTLNTVTPYPGLLVVFRL